MLEGGGTPTTYNRLPRVLLQHDYLEWNRLDFASHLTNSGVKQVDPLSSVLFNIVTCLDGGTTGAMAFADDKNLIAEIPLGLQTVIDHSKAYPLQCGMKINQGKSHTVSIVGLGKKKKTVVDVRHIL